MAEDFKDADGLGVGDLDFILDSDQSIWVEELQIINPREARQAVRPEGTGGSDGQSAIVPRFPSSEQETRLCRGVAMEWLECV